MYCIGGGDLDRDNDELAAWVLIIKTAEGLDGANESEGGGVGGEEKEVETKSVVRNIVTPLNSIDHCVKMLVLYLNIQTVSIGTICIF